MFRTKSKVEYLTLCKYINRKASEFLKRGHYGYATVTNSNGEMACFSIFDGSNGHQKIYFDVFNTKSRKTLKDVFIVDAIVELLKSEYQFGSLVDAKIEITELSVLEIPKAMSWLSDLKNQIDPEAISTIEKHGVCVLRLEMRSGEKRFFPVMKNNKDPRKFNLYMFTPPEWYISISDSPITAWAEMVNRHYNSDFDDKFVISLLKPDELTNSFLKIIETLETPDDFHGSVTSPIKTDKDVT